jgi:hypothetical protein
MSAECRVLSKTEDTMQRLRQTSHGSTQHSALSTQHFFTPRRWAVWLAETSGTLDAWLAGATVLDPTCGRGDLLFGLVAGAVRRGHSVHELPLRCLFGIEREPSFLRALVRDCRREFGVEFPRQNLRCTDFLLAPPQLQADALLGNPPWANFAALPADEKDALKPLFVRHGLVPDRRRLLLGGSRVDVAALVVAKAVTDHLRPNGNAAFYLPLSLLTGDGAHAGFRQYASFAVTAVFDFAGVTAFPGVATRYGAILLQRDAVPRWPIPWHSMDGNSTRSAAPVDRADGPLAIANDAAALDRLRDRPRIEVPPGTRPRQGVNPCGASRVLFVRDVRPLDDNRAEATSAIAGRVVLPRRFLYPLLTADQFADADAAPRRWVLLPHDPTTGQPLAPEQLAACPELADYLDRCRPLLDDRRGQWLRRWIDRGQWWALLGVGPYCFTPYRVAWPAYGATRFTPRVFAAPWQGQQALHAHIPCSSRKDAEALRTALARPEVEEYLRAFGSAGTRNFAQPGRVGRLLTDQISSHTTT